MTGEARRVALAFTTFFLLLCSYYVLRPVRDEMGVQTGASRLQWLFTGTFIATLALVPVFGWVVRRVPRARVLPFVYGFFVLNLVVFLVFFLRGITKIEAATFFIWLSVFNLFVVSLFWSNVSDTFTTEESHRLYGYIAAGGSAGALTGPAITAVIAKFVSTSTLLGISAVMLALAAVCGTAMRKWGAADDGVVRRPDAPIGGNVLNGIRLTFSLPTLRGLATLIICYTAVSTVLYVEQADVVAKTFSSSGERTSFFATIDLIINSLALLIQMLGTRAIVKRFGLRVALPIVPLLVMGALVVAGVWRAAVLLAIAQIIHRVGDFSLVRPGREMIYTTVDAESRYKAKSFIDTTIYRANDAASSWVVAAVRGAGLNSLLILGIPLAALWIATGIREGRRHDQHQQA